MISRVASIPLTVFCEIHHDDVRRQFTHTRNGFVTAAGFTQYFETAGGFQQGTKARTQAGVVVSEEYPDSHMRDYSRNQAVTGHQSMPWSNSGMIDDIAEPGS